jgi:hypothetical protein
MIKLIKTWFKTRRHKKELAKIKANLLKNPKLLLETQNRFEQAFGVNSQVRTAKQWQRLVKVYGIQQVMASENLTAIQVNQKCNERFANKFLKAQQK